MTKRLLEHWRDPEEFETRRFFFCQLEAVETLIWLLEAPAAERVGCHARALEIEPRLVDVAIRRWQAFARRDARHAESGLSFDEIAAEGSRAGRVASKSDEAKP